MGHLYIAAGGLVFVKISFSFLIFENNCISVASLGYRSSNDQCYIYIFLLSFFISFVIHRVIWIKKSSDMFNDYTITNCTSAFSFQSADYKCKYL
jgi:hypothetical protein